jgi:hypothetical protein
MGGDKVMKTNEIKAKQGDYDGQNLPNVPNANDREKQRTCLPKK